MPKSWSLLLLAVMAALLLNVSAVQARQYSYGTYLPPKAPGGLAAKYFIDTVEQQTDNKIKFAFYPSGSAASAKTTLSAINDGLIDGGMIVASYVPTSLPVNMVLSDLSFYNTGTDITSAAITDTILNDCPQCLNEYRKYNLHLLASYATSPYRMLCRSKLSDGFNPHGLRIRSPGDEFGHWIDKIGSVPVEIPNSEAYEALQRNQLNCMVGMFNWLKAFSLSEVVNGAVDLPMGASQGGALIDISQQAWEELDPKTQAIMQDAALKALAHLVYIYINGDREALAEAKKNGMNVIDASPDLIAKKAAFKNSEAERAVATARSRDVDNPEAIVQAFQKNMEKWQSLLKGKKLSEKEYYKLLVDNILSDSSNL